MRRYHIATRFDCGTRQWDERGRPVYDSTKIAHSTRAMQFYSGVAAPGRFELYKDPTTERYTTLTWQTVAFPALTFAGMRRLVRAGLLVDAPCGTFVEARLLTATEARWWNGSAWAVAGANDWNDPWDLMAQAGSWSWQSLGVAFRLKTDDGLLTPSVCGADFFLEIEHSPSSHDETIGSSWADDAILRSFGRSAEAGLELWRVDEFIADDQDGHGQFTLIDYSEGVGDTPANVTSVSEVYNLTADPHRAAPLPGTWDSTTKMFTLTSHLHTGNRVWTRYRIAPKIVLGGDRDIFTRVLPVFSIEALREIGSTTWSVPSLIINPFTEIGYKIAAPEEVDFLFDVAAIGRTEGEAWEAATALREWIGHGKRVRSLATCRYFDLVAVGAGSQSPRGDVFEVSVPVRLSGVLKWASLEESCTLFVEGVIEPNVSLRR